MRLIPSYRLQLEDLPQLESPSIATDRVRRALFTAFPSDALNLNLTDIPGLYPGMPPDIANRLIVSQVATGNLLLVCSGIGSDKPQHPLVTWQNEGTVEAPGAWRCAAQGLNVNGVVRAVAELNRQRLLPSGLYPGSGFGVAAATAQGSGANAPAAQAEPESPPPAPGLSLPLGASAQIKPLTSSNRNSPEPEPEKLHLVAGLFTDGTLNNVDNTEIFRKRLVQDCLEPLRADPSRLEDCQTRLTLRLGESYANGPTNVVKLFDLYREGDVKDQGERRVTLKVYQPGVGTRSGDSDSLLGAATGLGETGVQEQVCDAFGKLAREAARVIGSSLIDTLTVDLFGFSRGAAAARHAINEIAKGASGALGHAFAKEGLTWPASVNIRFAGLFDTVAGIVNPAKFDFSAGNDRNNPVELALDPTQVKNVVHLVAGDEKRANFALNSVKFANGQLPENFREVTLPGAHSDIGGGYPDLQTETVLLHPTITLRGSKTKWPRKTLEWDTLDSLNNHVESEGWIGPYNLPFTDESKAGLELEVVRDEHPVPDGRVELSLRMRRRVRGELSRVALWIMHGLARARNLQFRPLPDVSGTRIPAELDQISRALMRQAINGIDTPTLDSTDYKLLKQRYIHHSDHFNPIEWLMGERIAGLGVPAEELIHPLRPTRFRERTVHFNRSPI